MSRLKIISTSQGGNSIQTRRVVTNISNNQLQAVDRGWSTRLCVWRFSESVSRYVTQGIIGWEIMKARD